MFYCGCRACVEALTEQRYRRMRCAIALMGRQNILIDAPPELATQLSREGITNISHLALTHYHYDHIGGLGDLEFYIRLSCDRALPTIMSQETWAYLQMSFGFMTDCLDVILIEPGQIIEIGEVRLTAVKAAHAPGTLGFLIGHSNNRVAYLPDTGPLPADTVNRLHGIECLVLDATFWGHNRHPGEHLSFNEAIAIGLELKVRRLYLTHLSMHYDTPVTNPELEHAIEPYCRMVHVAYDGLRLLL